MTGERVERSPVIVVCAGSDYVDSFGICPSRTDEVCGPRARGVASWRVDQTDWIRQVCLIRRFSLRGAG